MPTRPEDWTADILARAPFSDRIELLTFRLTYQGDSVVLTEIPFEKGTTVSDLQRWAAE